ncbi:DUF3558 family protein [Gordonia neofelifaecis]|uniref:DUF3558 family protein n=1 Tax=Gordonia neofelifaecis TaxID=945692 RepID=UPI000A069CA5
MAWPIFRTAVVLRLSSAESPSRLVRYSTKPIAPGPNALISRQRVRGGLLLAVLSVAACGAVESPTDVSVSSASMRQSDDQGRRLPFDVVNSDRWNSANSGSEYEPCTALTATELLGEGIDPNSVSDAAGTNGQTLRGCKWSFAGGTYASRWRVGQFVGNSPGLVTDKLSKSTRVDVWLADVLIEGRVVGLHRTISGQNCDTYVQSGAAAVTTLVTYSGLTPPPPAEICDRALAFTRATISKMPL